jgi:hypothetical protein
MNLDNIRRFSQASISRYVYRSVRNSVWTSVCNSIEARAWDNIRLPNPMWVTESGSVRGSIRRNYESK